MSKKLTRSNNKMLAGVCAGIAEYFELDPTVVRVVFAACCIFWGTGILLYIAAAIIIPDANARAKDDIIVDSEPDDSDYE